MDSRYDGLIISPLVINILRVRGIEPGNTRSQSQQFPTVLQKRHDILVCTGRIPISIIDGSLQITMDNIIEINEITHLKDDQNGVFMRKMMMHEMWKVMVVYSINQSIN